MAQKTGLNFRKIMSFIGIELGNNRSNKVQDNQRYQADASYDEPRYTPARARKPREDYGVFPGEEAEGYEDVNYARREAPQRKTRQDAPGRQAGFARGRQPQGGERDMVRSDMRMQTSSSTMVYYLHSLSECGDVIQDLIRGNSVFMNLEETDSAQTQRIVDTLAGATFALNAKIRKVSEKTYLIAPKNVSVNMTRSVERRY